ncbi:NAD-dependent epimerase/dehydratase family protein [Pseudonocardia sp. CA-142604]|uniref:NAD-dependent epimerase/dehydratase family protein n=1 Tax=Pseudonocardia sp. CA-142604 TaxID=3240024 RepID=UPI003D8E860D
MRIAVTGAAGRLGREVVDRALRAGHEVVAIDLPGSPAQGDGGRPALEWRPADVTVLDEVRAALAGVQGVAHLAALPHPRYPEPEVHRINVGGTHNVLIAAEEHGVSAVCLASSVNAIGGVFSARPRFDYFPVDEEHPPYCEDSYSQSKWLVEQQGAAFARRRPDATFSSLRLNTLQDDWAAAAALGGDEKRAPDLWGWTSFDSAASAVLLALHRRTPGHAVYTVVAARTTSTTPSEELARRWYPQVALRAPLPDCAAFQSSAKALAELGWDAREEHPAISERER